MVEIEILEDKSDEEVKKILYDDWNFGNDKYGRIKNKGNDEKEKL